MAINVARPRGRHAALARSVAAGLAVLALTGCYRNTELATPVPEPGTRIIAELTPTGAERLEGWIGADARAVEAVVAETRPEEWSLSLLRVEHHRSPGVMWNRETVVFPTDALRGVQERRFDALRTGVLTAGITTAVVILARNFMWSWFSDASDPPPDPVH